MSDVPEDDEHSAEQVWTEEASSTFIDTADLFVPARSEQIASLVALIPARPDDEFTLAELASGDGLLARAVLEAFPRCRYLALDGSEVMRAQTRTRLASFADRVEVAPFRLEERDWREALPRPLSCVLSSLCVHHLDGAGKRLLFADIVQHLEPGGALLLADLVEPATPTLAALYARQYDAAVQTQSLARYGDLRGFERFKAARWNYFAYDFGVPDSGDYPSVLSDQLAWLRAAGFTTVDCFWLRAGHAIYGGYK
jgi:tRNA (cmo5U34)-methyltransferase